MKDKTPCSWALSLFKRAPAFFILIAALSVSTQATAQWTKQAGLTATKINTIAVDPTDPNRLFAGTDLIETNQSLSGLYMTTNGGQTWTQVTSSSMAGKAIRSISIGAGSTFTNNRKVFVSVANQGIFKSLDGGITWTTAHIQNPSIPGSFLTQNVSQVIVTGSSTTTTSQKIYALVNGNEQNAPNSQGIYFTNNDGVSWQKVNNNIIQRIMKLVVPANQPETLYVLTESNELMKSTSGGTNFIAANSGLPTGIGAFVIDFVIDPNNANTLYASAFQNGVQGVYKTTNGGASWQSVNSTYVFHKLAVGSSTTSFNPTLYAISNQSTGTIPNYTVMTSTDGGISWSKLDPAFNSQLSTQTLSVITANNGTVYVGGQDGLYVYGGTNGPVQGNGLNISATTTPFSYTPGQPVTFNISLQNTSGQLQSNVTVSTNAFPLGTTNFQASTSNGNASCTWGPVTRVVSCSNVSLQINGNTSLSFSVTPPSTSTSLPLTITATGLGVNASTTLNLSSGNLPPGNGQGISMTVTPTSTTVAPGTIASMSVVLQNTSGSPLNNITVSSGQLPAGVTMLANQFCTSNVTTFTCTVNSILAGGSVTLPISLNVPVTFTGTSLSVSLTATGAGVSANGNAFFTVSGTTPIGNPIAQNVFLSTSPNQNTTGQLSGSAGTTGQILTYRIVTNGTKGVLSFSGQPGVTQSVNPSVTYTPNLNQSGQDTITYVVETGDGANRKTSAPATVTVTISGPSQNPNGNNGAKSSGGALHPLFLAMLALPLLFRRRMK